MIPKKLQVYQIISNWPPGDEWFVKFNYIREDNAICTNYQKVLWFKEISATSASDAGMYIPMFQCNMNTRTIVAYIDKNGVPVVIGRAIISQNTKVQFSVEQRRSITDQKFYVKFYKDGEMIGNAIENTNKQVFEKVGISIGSNVDEINHRVSEFTFGKL